MAITMGDPCGIGPEVIVKALSDMTPADRQAFVIVGSQEILDRANTVFKTNLNFSDIESNYLNNMYVHIYTQIIILQKYHVLRIFTICSLV